MDMVRALGQLGGYTAGQWGMVTVKQAAIVGVDDVTLHRLKLAGLLEPVRRGVYAATAADVSEARPEQAAWLALRPEVAGWERPKLDPDGGVISHLSATRLHGIGDFAHTRVEMTVPRRRTTRDPGVWLRTAKLVDSDVTLLNGLPVTTPTRTICDLLDRRVDASHIATVIRQAGESGQVDFDELAERVAPYARRYGARPLNGADLLESLLAQIGLSVREISMRQPPRMAWGDPKGLTWADLVDRKVTWGELAHVAPEIAERLKRLPVVPDAGIESGGEK